jgi:drug/metabolite transporter superfamily protein YnfA
MVLKILASITLICLPIILTLLLTSIVLVERKRVDIAGKVLVAAGGVFIAAASCAVTLAIISFWWA